MLIEFLSLLFQERRREGWFMSPECKMHSGSWFRSTGSLVQQLTTHETNTNRFAQFIFSFVLTGLSFAKKSEFA